MNIKSAAFPWMGAMNGGLPLDEIKRITRYYLSDLSDILIEIYDFDPNVSDPLFNKLKLLADNMQSLDIKKLTNTSGIQLRYIENIISTIQDRSVMSLSQLIESKVIGKNNIEKLYAFLITPKSDIKYLDNPSLFPTIQYKV